MLTIDQVKNVSFRKSGMGGYKAEDVDAFIDEVILTFNQFETERADVMKKIEILVQKIEAYRKDEEIIKNALMRSERIAEDALKEAKERSEKIITQAEERSAKMLSEANAATQAKKDEYLRLSDETAKFRAELMSMYKKQLQLIGEMPDEKIAYSRNAEINKRYPTEEVHTKSGVSEEISSFSEPKNTPKNIPTPVIEENPVVKAPVVTVPEKKAEPVVTPISAVISDEDKADLEKTQNFSLKPTVAAEDIDYVMPKKDKKTRKFSVLKFGDNYDVDDE